MNSLANEMTEGKYFYRPKKIKLSVLTDSKNWPVVYLTVVFEDVRLLNTTGREAVYVDGGVLCNYPIFCFDGKKLLIHPTIHVCI
jgi:hypothetical protein